MDKSVLEVLEQEYKKADKELSEKRGNKSVIGCTYYGGMKHGILRIVSALYGEEKEKEIFERWSDEILRAKNKMWNF